MRRAEIVTAFLLGIFSVYLMWKSGDHLLGTQAFPALLISVLMKPGLPEAVFGPFGSVSSC